MITKQKIVVDTVQATCTTTYTNIAVLIPAHNEEACIEKAVRSVMEQSVCTSSTVCIDVLVIADNCSDRTGEIVLALQQEYPNLYLTRTVNNKDRKAGALNHGFQFIKRTGRAYTYTFTMDADSVLDPYIIENGMEGIAEQYGGICCRVGLLPLELEHFAVKPCAGKVASWVWICWLLRLIVTKLWWLCDQFRKRIWWAFQNIEYSIAQSESVERLGRANCLCGPGTLFRTSVLQELLEKNGEVWHGDALVEDYWLTKQIQNAGYKTRVGHTMFAYTDVPLSFRDHWRQRTRWYGGNISTWFSFGLNRHTIFESPDLGFQVLWFSCRIALILTFIHILATGFIYIDRVSAWLLWLPVVTTLLNLFRFRYVAYKSLLQLCLLVCLAYELYAIWYGIVLLGSFYTAYTLRPRW